MPPASDGGEVYGLVVDKLVVIGELDELEW